MNLFRPTSQGVRRRTLYREQTRAEAKLTAEKRSGPATGAAGIVRGDIQTRRNFLAPVPLFLDSQMLGRQTKDKGGSLSARRAVVGGCCRGPGQRSPVACGWIKLGVVGSSRFASLRGRGGQCVIWTVG